MSRLPLAVAAAAAALIAAAGPSLAQTTAAPAAPATPAPAASAAAPAAAAAPSSLSVFFNEGSATIRPQDATVLDQAARLYRDGNPIVMILTGSTDATGSALGNISLSQRRANAVLAGLVARGIPAARFQILAKGSSEPPVADDSGKAEPQNRRVVIAWH